MIGSERARRAAGLGGLVAGQGLRWAGTRAANTVRGTDRAQAASERRTMATADEIVERLGSMKGAAMKLGQVLSTVDMGLVPEAEREAFKTKLGALRDAAEPVAFADVRKVLEADLGRPLTEAFASFEQEAFAAASIGQVHRARTHDGAQVAVKVQYPRIAEAVEADLRNINVLFPLIRRMAPGLDVKAVTNELRSRISEELDYELEAQSQRRIARAFRGHPFIHVPAVHTALCGRRVLVTDYVEGIGFDEVKRLPEDQRDRFGEIVFRFFFSVLHRLSTSLGDPHPGNYLLRPDGRVCFLDFGLLRRMNERHLADERALSLAVADGDAGRVHERLSALGYLPAGEPFDAAMLLAQVQAASSWMLGDSFTRLTPDIVRASIEVAGSPRSPFFEQMRRQTLPPQSLLLRRMEGLLFAILGELRAGADWTAITDEQLRGAAPGTPLGVQDAAFWQARRAGQPSRARSSRKPG